MFQIQLISNIILMYLFKLVENDVMMDRLFEKCSQVVFITSYDPRIFVTFTKFHRMNILKTYQSDHNLQIKVQTKISIRITNNEYPYGYA